MNVALKNVERSHIPQSTRFKNYLHDPVYVFPNGVVSYSRSDIARLTEAPCPRAPGALFKALHRYHIKSPEQLYRTGLDGLLRCTQIGERAAWIAAVLLGNSGYDVTKWCDMKRRKTQTVRGSIRLVASQTRKQKHG
jgi:hypothetical protein